MPPDIFFICHRIMSLVYVLMHNHHQHVIVIIIVIAIIIAPFIIVIITFVTIIIILIIRPWRNSVPGRVSAAEQCSRALLTCVLWSWAQATHFAFCNSLVMTFHVQFYCRTCGRWWEKTGLKTDDVRGWMAKDCSSCALAGLKSHCVWMVRFEHVFKFKEVVID